MTHEQPLPPEQSAQPQVIDISVSVDEIDVQNDISGSVDEIDVQNDTSVTEPGRLIRIASMTRAMLEEVRVAPLDDAGRQRLLEVYDLSLDQLRDSLSSELQDEMVAIFRPLESASASESELRLAQAQLVGWLEGLFSGIQASLFSQQAAVTVQLEEMRRRRLEGAEVDSGHYL